MSDPIGYKGDLTLSLHVRDMEAAIRWYTEMLGFELIYKLDEMGWCEMRSPVKDVTVGLGQVKEMAPHDGCVPVWGVVNIEASRRKLEKMGVRFDGPTHEITGMVKLATFYDPDNNAWMLVQSLQAGA
jgi:catechol 2,3-dioxygenase-like lactoylglutathione lyase family enzyme